MAGLGRHTEHCDFPFCSLFQRESSWALGTAPMAELLPALLLLAKNHRSHRVWLKASEQQGHGERESAAGWGWRGSKHAPSCLTSAWEGVDEHGGISAAMRRE